jgi:polyferredoxin
MAKAKDVKGVTIVEVDRSTTEVEQTSWYNKVNAASIDRWRIWPRLLITLYGVMFYKSAMWFMALPDPTNAQSAFISVIVGAGAAWFGLYCGSGGKVSK